MSKIANLFSVFCSRYYALSGAMFLFLRIKKTTGYFHLCVSGHHLNTRWDRWYSRWFTPSITSDFKSKLNGRNNTASTPTEILASISCGKPVVFLNICDFHHQFYQFYKPFLKKSPSISKLGMEDISLEIEQFYASRHRFDTKQLLLQIRNPVISSCKENYI